MKTQRTGKSEGRTRHLPYITIVMVFFVIIAAIFLYKSSFDEQKKTSDRKILPESAGVLNEPQFVKEGELQFLHKAGGAEIKKIDIEIADNAYEREKGLMYRHSLPESAGMLFIFERPAVLSFWMRNTYIPLDIIFAGEDKQIVTIRKNAKPLSYGSIPSRRNAMYVVEVNGGFCDKYGIGVGDHLVFDVAGSRDIKASTKN